MASSTFDTNQATSGGYIIPTCEFANAIKQAATQRFEPLVQDLYGSKEKLDQDSLNKKLELLLTHQSNVKKKIDDILPGMIEALAEKLKPLAEHSLSPQELDAAAITERSKLESQATAMPLAMGFLLPIPYLRTHYLLVGRYANPDSTDLYEMSSASPSNIAKLWIVPKEHLRYARLQQSDMHYIFNESPEALHEGEMGPVTASFIKTAEFFCLNTGIYCLTKKEFSSWEILSLGFAALLGHESFLGVYKEKPFYQIRDNTLTAHVTLMPSLMELIGLCYRLNPRSTRTEEAIELESEMDALKFQHSLSESLSALSKLYSVTLDEFHHHANPLLSGNLFQGARSQIFFDSLKAHAASKMLYQAWSDPVCEIGSANQLIHHLVPAPYPKILRQYVAQGLFPKTLASVSRMKTIARQKPSSHEGCAQYVASVELQSLPMVHLFSIEMEQENKSQTEPPETGLFFDHSYLLSAQFGKIEDAERAASNLQSLHGTDEKYNVTWVACTSADKLSKFFVSQALAAHQILAASELDLKSNNPGKAPTAEREKFWNNFGQNPAKLNDTSKA